MIAEGIDPGGNDGAAAIIDTAWRPHVLTFGCAWSKAKRKGGDVMRMWEAGHGVWDEPANFDPIAWVSARKWAITAAGVEGHPPRMGGRAHGMNLAHVREIGRVCGWVEALTGITPTTPAPAVWRRAVFGIAPGTDSKTCDAMILARLPALVTLPPDVPAWAMKHLPDACGVALYAAMEIA